MTVGDGTTVRIEVVNGFDPALGPASAGEDPGSGFLPDTGTGRALLALALLGLVLLGAGVALVLRGRRLQHG